MTTNNKVALITGGSTIYHHPRGWDHVPTGSEIPHGESCQWGDYHLREAGLYVQRLVDGSPYYAFFGPR